MVVSYYTLGATYPRTKLRQPYPRKWRRKLSPRLLTKVKLFVSPLGISESIGFGLPNNSPGIARLTASGMVVSQIVNPVTIVPGLSQSRPSSTVGLYALGNPVISSGVAYLSPNGISSSFSMGLTSINPLTIMATLGIPSSFDEGNPNVVAGKGNINPNAATFSYQAGIAQVTTGRINLVGKGVSLACGIGSITVGVGGVFLGTAGISVGITYGNPAINFVFNISPSGINANIAVGRPAAIPGLVALESRGLSWSSIVTNPVFVPGGIVLNTQSVHSNIDISTAGISIGRAGLVVSSVLGSLHSGVPRVIPGVKVVAGSPVITSFSVARPNIIITMLTLDVEGIDQSFAAGNVEFVPIPLALLPTVFEISADFGAHTVYGYGNALIFSDIRNVVIHTGQVAYGVMTYDSARFGLTNYKAIRIKGLSHGDQ